MKKKGKAHSAHCEKMQQWSYLVMRVAFGLFFFFSGLPKLQALFAGSNPLTGFGIPLFLAWVVGIVEVVGGAFLVFGLFSMYSGLLIAITMLVALIMTQFSPFNAKGVFQHLLYIGVAMVLATYQDKFCSLDAIWCKKK